MSKKININEALELVDVILDGNYKTYKEMGRVDNILDEIENAVDTVPDQDIPELQDDVEDELSKDERQKGMTVEQMMKDSVKRLVVEEDYREYFKSMLKNWNIKSPTELPEDKRKKFFNAVDKGWKAEKEKKGN